MPLTPAHLIHQVKAEKKLLLLSCYWSIRATEQTRELNCDPPHPTEHYSSFKPPNHKHLCQVIFFHQSGFRDGDFPRNVPLCGPLISFSLTGLFNCEETICLPPPTFMSQLAHQDVSYPCICLSLPSRMPVTQAGLGNLNFIWPLFKMEVLFKMTSVCFFLTLGNWSKWIPVSSRTARTV